MKRMLISGIRPAGESRFTCAIVGNADSQFPPIRLTATLRELNEWLSHTRGLPQAALAGSGIPGRVILRVVH